MVVALTVILIVSASLLIGIYMAFATKRKIKEEMGVFSTVGIVVAIVLALTIAFAPIWILATVRYESADSTAIDLDNCRYVGAEVYTADDNRTVFIDITSGDGVLYAYDGQVDTTAQYMLTLDAKTGEVLVVWQNVH